MTNKLFLALFTSLLWLWSAPSAAQQLLDRVAAIVNDQVILQSELDGKTRETAMSLQAKNIPVNNLRELQIKVLDSLILEMLQKQRAAELGLRVSDEDINEQLIQIAQKNQMSLFDLQQRLNAQQADGFVQLRANIEKQLLIQKLREQEVISRTLVTEEEIQNYLQRSRLDNSQLKSQLRHLLITLPESASAQQRNDALAKIKALRARIMSGESFEQLAVRHSQGSKALSGGDLGWLKQEQIPTFFAEALQDMEIGDVSPVISSPSGYHLIKLENRRDGSGVMVQQYKLHRFIVLSDDALSQPTVPETIQQQVLSIRDTESFKELGALFADIPASVNAGGDLGWMSISELPSDLVENLKKAPNQRVLDPIATDQGWVLFFKEGERLFDEQSANAEKKAIQEIRLRKANETFEIWLQRMKDEAFIDIRL